MEVRDEAMRLYVLGDAIVCGVRDGESMTTAAAANCWYKCTRSDIMKNTTHRKSRIVANKVLLSSR